MTPGLTFNNKQPVQYLRGFESDDFTDNNFIQKFLKIRQTKIKKIRIFPLPKHQNGLRKTMASTLPWYLDGVSELKPNDNDLASQIDGAKHRVGGVVPSTNPATVKKFARFVKKWLQNNLTPLPHDTDCSVETWLKESPYTLQRQADLIKTYTEYMSELNNDKCDPHKLESFIKDEFYICPKTMRTINSRLDFYKCLVGPTIHQVEKKVFALPYFIKKVPVSERAELIWSRLYMLGAIYGAIDFTSYEASFSQPIMKACEIQLFDYMTMDLPNHSEFKAMYRQLLLSNKLCFSGFLVEVLHSRMSGEMSTSVSNGFSTLMLVLFTGDQMGIVIILFVEGDDVIFSSIMPIDCRWFVELGFIAKYETYASPTEASFCGLIFAAPGHNIRDPIHVLMKLGWCTQQYNRATHRLRMHLLRAKALSLKCELPNCPILSVLADRLIFLTSGLKNSNVVKTYVKRLSLYHRERYLELMNELPKVWNVPPLILPESRVLMETLYKITVVDQLHIENAMSSCSLGPFSDPVLDEYIHPDNFTYFQMYVKTNVVPTEHDVMVKRRHDYYATQLPDNLKTDFRTMKQQYSVGVL
jgi:hypothetical protein